MSRDRDNEQHYIIEYHQVGRFVKVSAVDPVTLTEVSITGDPKSDNRVLARVAVNKLKRKLENR